VSDLRLRNEAIARRLWQGASLGDPAPLLDMDPKVRWRTFGTGPNAGEFVGLDAVLRYLAATGEGVDSMHSELIDVFASARGAVIHYRTEFVRGTKTLEGEYFLFLRIEADVVREVTAVPWDQAAARVFWEPH